MALWKQIVIALLLGLIFGFVLYSGMLGDSVKDFMLFIASIFFNLIKMLIVPLIFVSLVSGMARMDDLGSLGRVASKTISIYLITTAVAILIGIAIASAVGLGNSADIELASVPEKIQAAADKKLTVTGTILGLVPTNIVSAFASGDILPIIVFSLLLGTAIVRAGDKGKTVEVWFHSMAEIMYSFVNMIMKVAPIGVFAIIAWAVAEYGPKIIGNLAMVILVCYLASIIHAVLVYGGILYANGLSPKKFFKKVLTPAVFAFASTSSSGTLPLSMQTSREGFGVSERTSAFVLPLGATINMDGTAIYQGVCAIFIANAFGVDLSMTQYAMIILMSTLASIGTAGTPGAGLIMLSGMLVAIGLPLEGVGLIFAIDRLLDMARTSLNVIGDNMVAVVIDKSEKNLSEEVYNQ